MRPLDIIAAAPWPSLPVFAASAMMPFVYVGASSAQLSLRGAAVDPLTLTVVVRLLLHVLIKVPRAVDWARAIPERGPEREVILPLACAAALGVPALLVWANSAVVTQLVWSALLGAVGLIGLRVAVEEGGLDRRAQGPDPWHAMGTDLAEALNIVLFAVVCGLLAVLGPQTLWVLYAGIGWIAQIWILGWAWLAFGMTPGERQSRE